MIPTFADIPEHLEGEPHRPGTRGGWLWLRACLGLAVTAVLFGLLLPLWIPYLAMVAAYGWPPNVPRRAQVVRYLRRAWTERPPAPGLCAGQRAWLTVLVLRKAVWIPVRGAAWLLDELLYRRRLDAIEVRAPLFEISAGRSGSTQLARYLEDDASLAAPSFLLSVFPYLWLWRLAPATAGRWISKERLRHWIEARLPPEFVERHEGDPFRTDTFEASLYLAHLNHLCFFFGPTMAEEEFGMARTNALSRSLWEEDFVLLLERVGRKCLLMAGPGPGGEAKRLFVKGHFLCAAPALARRFPDARFLTMVRVPDARLQSAVNYLRANPFDATLGPAPWAWIAEALLGTEVAYCEAEQTWFTATDGPSRCVVRFDDYVRDLPATMTRVYAECLDGPLPPGIPREHPPRRRGQYLLNRSLAQVGIDAEAVNQRLESYVRWCREESPKRPAT
jgi:hypothetical protein